MVLLGCAMRICVCFRGCLPLCLLYRVVHCKVQHKLSACILLEISVRCILLYVLRIVIPALSQEIFCFSSEALYIEQHQQVTPS